MPDSAGPQPGKQNILLRKTGPFPNAVYLTIFAVGVYLYEKHKKASTASTTTATTSTAASGNGGGNSGYYRGGYQNNPGAMQSPSPTSTTTTASSPGVSTASATPTYTSAPTISAPVNGAQPVGTINPAQSAAGMTTNQYSGLPSTPGAAGINFAAIDAASKGPALPAGTVAGPGTAYAPNGSGGFKLVAINDT